MRVINRYLLGEFQRLFLLALCAFVGIYLLVDFFEKIDNFLAQHAEVVHYLGYFSCKVPLIVVQVIPLALLLGVFLTIGGFARSQELTAMRAGGMSLLRIATPLLVVGLVVSLLVLAANEWLVPLTIRKANHILKVELGGRKGETPTFKRDRLWLRDNETVVNIALALPEQNILQGVTLFTLTADGQPLSRVDARRARYTGDGWQGEEVATSTFDPQNGELLAVTKQAALPLALTKTPDDFKSTISRSEEMGIRELAELARRVRLAGYDATRFEVDLHGRLATPFASFIMAFLGIPFALQRGRGSSLAAGIAISVAIGICYHLAQGMLLAFGYSAALPPMVAAWAPNLLFALLGIWLIQLTRQ